VDFITGLPRAQGKDCIFVVVDRLTKFAHLFPIATDFGATQLAELFFREVFRLHGLPKTIISDRDSRFMSTFWQELFRLVGMTLTPSTSYHPHMDGQTEIVNKWVESYLRNYVPGQQKAWVRWLHWENIATTPPNICPLACHLSEHYIAMIPYHLWRLHLVTAGLRWYRIGYSRAKTSSGN
jgi:hypothetical protein